MRTYIRMTSLLLLLTLTGLYTPFLAAQCFREGVIAGFDGTGRPLPPAPEHFCGPAGFHQTQASAPPAETVPTVVCDSSVDIRWRPYLTELLATALEHAPRFYGPHPDPMTTIRVSYDAAHAGSGWFFYNVADHAIVITGYPSPAAGSANDPKYDAILVHELLHSFHDDLGVFLDSRGNPDPTRRSFASWVEEGMTEAATELLAEYLRARSIRDIRWEQLDDWRSAGRNVLLFDTWNQMGADVLGGRANVLDKAYPELLYGSSSSLFLLLAASQSSSPDPGSYTFLKDLNAALREEKIREQAPYVTDAVFYSALEKVCTQPVDGLSAASWIRGQSATAPEARTGVSLGLYAAYAGTGDSRRFTVVSPEWFRILSLLRTEKDGQVKEERLHLASPVPLYATVYDSLGQPQWSATTLVKDDRGKDLLLPYVPFDGQAAGEWIHMGRLSLAAGWYRIRIECDVPGTGRLSAENMFLYLPPEGEAQTPATLPAGTVALLSQGAGSNALPMKLSAGENTVFQNPPSRNGETLDPLGSPSAALAAPRPGTPGPARVRVQAMGSLHTLTAPGAFSRVIPIRTHTQWLPSVEVSPKTFTGIGLASPSARPNQLSIEWRSETGTPATFGTAESPSAIRNYSLLDHEQMAFMPETLFTSNRPETGWIRLSSTDPISAFALKGDLSGTRLDGIPALRDPGLILCTPFCPSPADGTFTLCLLNPATSGDDVFYSLEIRNENGELIQQDDVTYPSLPPMGQVTLSPLAKLPASAGRCYIVVRSWGQPILGSCTFQSDSALATWPLSPISDTRLDVSTPVSTPVKGEPLPTVRPAEFLVPHFAQAPGQYATRVHLVNLSDSLPADVALTVTCHLPEGSPIPVRDVRLFLQLSPGALRTIDLGRDVLFMEGIQATSGWIRIETSHTQVQSAVSLSSPDQRILTVQPATAATARHFLLAHVAQGAEADSSLDFFTGLAFCNPTRPGVEGEGAANVTVRLWQPVPSEDGKSEKWAAACQGSLRLLPGQQVCRMLPDFFLDEKGQTTLPALLRRGWIEVDSDRPISGSGLFGDAQQQFLTILPPAEIR